MTVTLDKSLDLIANQVLLQVNNEKTSHSK